MIGKTRERYCVVAYGYQKAFQWAIQSNNAHGVGLLSKMFENYTKARIRCKNIPFTKEGDAMASEAISYYILRIAGGEVEPDFFEKNKTQHEDYDRNMAANIQYNGTVDAWLAKAHIQIVLLFADDLEEVTHAKNIERAYFEAFKSFLNTRKLSEELDYYFEFLLDAVTFYKDASLERKIKLLEPTIEMLRRLKRES